MISTDQTIALEKGRILIMDDDEEALAVEADILTNAGYSVGLARSGDEAVELFRKAEEEGKPFDVVMLELTVSKGMGAVWTFKELLKVDPKIKAIISSGHLDGTDGIIIENITRFGFQGILFKPSSSSQLVEVVGNVMKKSV
jgi:DNA-binding NtrC family response regulator